MNKICLGAGLISLDILINDHKSNRPISYYVGGTCGNVMMILSHMGWDSYPVARLDNNKQTDRLIADMVAHGVHTTFVTTDTGKTPVIIQHNIIDKDGMPTHKFEFKNSTGRFFLSFSPITIKQADMTLNSLEFVPGLFFFDRISPAYIKMAKKMKELGALIYFEPSCKVTTKRFMECVEISDIIKFSDQRIPELDFFDAVSDKLIIQTLGNKGLRFKQNNSQWYIVPSISNENIVDTSGAGDWTTSAFLNILFSRENQVISNLDIETIKDFLLSAQKVGALSCSFEGARGMMNLSWDEISESIVQM